MTPKRLLLSFAHPDDESFALGGLIAKYVSEGAEVYYICSTRGNRGTVDEKYLQKYGSIDAVRDAELECASNVLGFKEIFKLGYGDSGMMGSPDNDDPDCLWQADDEELTAQIMTIMLQVKPQVVICDNEFGGYGHPDHIKMHRLTTRAFMEIRESGEHTLQKLYHTTFTRRPLARAIFWLKLQGKDPRKMGRNKDIDYVQILDNIPPHHTKINIKPWLETWRTANRCHESQLGERSPRWRRTWNRFLQRINPLHQLLYRRYPEPQPDDSIETDIFTGVKLS